MTTLDPGPVDELLSTTRAVRRRLELDRAVDPKVIIDCLELALQAPTGGNSQGWRWVVVTDPQTRAALADLYRRADGGRFRRRAERTRQTDPQTGRVYSSAGHLLDVLDRVPVHVIPCIHGRLQSPNPVEAASLYGSVLPAVWSFMLALRSRGLGSVWTTLHLVYEQEAAELLGIPADYTQVALIPVAHTDPEVFRPAARRPSDEVTFWNRWGQAGPP
jgi:nitroreductase